MVAMNVQIEVFCQKYNIEEKKVYHIQLLLEELIVEIIKRCYTNKQPDIVYSIEYSDEENEINISLTYKADDFNPFSQEGSDEESLGMLLVSRISKASDHMFDEGFNTINIKL
jgi:anti-sigma regulatory factor (Ser/Thr protein kinase)